MLKNLLLSFLLLFALSSSAQNYQPFYGPENMTFKYLIDETAAAPVQEYCHIRVDSSAPGLTYFPLVSGDAPSGWNLDLEHDLGAYVVAQPGGLYEFHSQATGDTIFLHTQMPLNTSWTFRSDSNITAQILLRQQLNLFGTTPDSVLLIGLSDGNEIHLSQNHGMIYFPVFSAYFKGDPMLHYSLTENAAVRTIRDFYGWNPGDHFGTYEWKNNGRDYYSHFVVLSATVSPDGNDLTFALDRRLIDIFPDADTTEILDTVSFHISAATHPWLLLGSDEYYRVDTTVLKLVDRIYTDSFYNDLPATRVQHLWWDSIEAFTPYFTWVDYARYAPTIGLTRDYYVGQPLAFFGWRDYHLECYEIGGYAKLPCRDLDALLTAVDGPLTPESTIDVFPNPSDGDFHLRWETASPKNVAIDIYDLGGRKIWGKQASVLPASGGMELHAGLQAGIYLLVLSGEGGILWREKVVVR